MRIWTRVDRSSVSSSAIPFVLASWLQNPEAEAARVSALLLARRPEHRGLHIEYAAYFFPPSWINYDDPLTWFRTGPHGYTAARQYAERFWRAMTVRPTLISLDHEEFMSTFRYGVPARPTTPGVALAPAWSDPVALAAMPPHIRTLNPATFDAAGETRRLAINAFNQWAVSRDFDFLSLAVCSTYAQRFSAPPRLVNYEAATYPNGYESVNNFSAINRTMVGGIDSIGCPVLYIYTSDSRAGGDWLEATRLTIRRLTDCTDRERIPWVMPAGGIDAAGGWNQFADRQTAQRMLANACRDNGVTDVLLFDWSPSWVSLDDPNHTIRHYADGYAGLV